MNWTVKTYPMNYGRVRQPYSKSVVVGNLVFLSGMTGANPDTGEIDSKKLEDQVVTALDKVRMAMEEAGSSMDHIVKITNYIKDVKDYPHMQKTELAYFQKHAPLLLKEPPACTLVQPRCMDDPRFLAGMDVIGVISLDEPGWEVKKYPAYWGGEKQPYSKFVMVGNLLLPSAIGPENPATGKVESDNLEEQLLAVHDNMKRTLEEAGSSMNNIVKTFHHLREGGLPRPMWKSELEYYQKHARVLIEENPPASTFWQLSALAKSDYLVEIDMIAAISRNKPGWEVKKHPLYYGDVKRYFAKWVSVGNLMFLSGNAGGTPLTGEIQSDDLEHQMLQSLIRTKLGMEAAGSSLNNIIRSLHFVKNLEDIPSVVEIETEYYRKHAPRLLEEPPVSTFVQPYSLANPRYQMEIEHIAVISRW
jgi:enamine deaminase RidA (YjgF/YER057c/UK114 family)